MVGAYASYSGRADSTNAGLVGNKVIQRFFPVVNAPARWFRRPPRQVSSYVGIAGSNIWVGTESRTNLTGTVGCCNAGIHAAGGVLHANAKTTIANITDGSNTIVVGETSDWMVRPMARSLTPFGRQTTASMGTDMIVITRSGSFTGRACNDHRAIRSAKTGWGNVQHRRLHSRPQNSVELAAYRRVNVVFGDKLGSCGRNRLITLGQLATRDDGQVVDVPDAVEIKRCCRVLACVGRRPAGWVRDLPRTSPARST